MRYLVFLICSLLFLSCIRNDSSSGKRSTKDDVVLNGVVKYYDEQHRLISEVTYKDGLRHGLTRNYYNNGSVKDEIMFQYDQKQGMAKKFHKNGNIYSLTLYNQGERHGIQKKYYPNGMLWAETPYRNGQPGIGLKEYDRTGELRTVFPRIEIQKFHRNGKVSLKVFLSNHSKNVVFYMSDLIEDKYIPQRINPVESEAGIGSIEIPMKSGVALDTTLSIIAKYRTIDHNIYVTRRLFHLEVLP